MFEIVLDFVKWMGVCVDQINTLFCTNYKNYQQNFYDYC